MNINRFLLVTADNSAWLSFAGTLGEVVTRTTDTTELRVERLLSLPSIPSVRYASFACVIIIIRICMRETERRRAESR